MAEQNLDRLREPLEKNFQAPGVFLFKFIIPNDNKSLARTLALFDDTAVVHTRESSGGKYTAVSAEEMMMNVDSIIEKYKLAFQIEGLISL